MGLSASFFKNMFLKLLPQGKAWEGETFQKLMAGFADEHARIDSRAKNLVEEADPRTAYELLQDWERLLGLPTECVGIPPSIQERRRLAHTFYTLEGGQSRSFMISLAAALGYTIEIEEYKPFRAGDHAGDRCYGTQWVFVFGVISTLGSIRVFRAGSLAGERLREFGNEALECLINEIKPAHTYALFKYL